MTEFVIARNMLLHLLRFAGQRGLDLEHLYVRLGLAEAGDMIPFASFAHVAEAVGGREPDVTGLYMGSQLNVAALGIVGQLIQHSRTIREALTLASDRFNLISNVLKLDLEEGEEIMRLVFSVNADCMARYPETCRMLLASSMTFAWMEVEYLTLKQVQPLSVHWPIKPVDPAPFEKTFGLGGQFGAEGYTLVFPASVLELPIVYADYALLMRMEALACSRLQAVQGEAATFTDQVRRLVYGLIDPGFPSLDTLAGHLHLTTRTLQRRLRAEGTNYSALINLIKKEMARSYLEQKLSVKEVSYLLGYAEPSAFVHAFKGWYGQTPGGYVG